MCFLFLTQASGKSRAKNKEDIVVDSFFWPMLKYNSKSVEDEYDVPIPEKDEFEGHDEAIYSIWQHYVDFCIKSKVVHSKMISFDQKSVSSRNAEAKKILNKYSHRSGVREPLDQQRNDGVNRYISKDRLSVFQHLSKGEPLPAFSDAASIDVEAKQLAEGQKEGREEDFDLLTRWPPTLSLIQLSDSSRSPSDLFALQHLPFEIDHHGPLSYAHSLPDTRDGHLDYGSLSDVVLLDGDEEESAECTMASNSVPGRAFVLREPAASGSEFLQPNQAKDSETEDLVESPVPSAGNSPRSGLFTRVDDSAGVSIGPYGEFRSSDLSPAAFDTRPLANLEHSDLPHTARLSAESLKAHQDSLRISGGSCSGMITPLLDMTEKPACDCETPSRLTEETDVELVSPLSMFSSEYSKSLPKTAAASVLLPFRLPDDLDVPSDATEVDSSRLDVSRQLDNQSLLGSDDAPPPRLSASPRVVTDGPCQKSTNPKAIGVEYALRGSCENAVRNTLLSPPADSIHVKHAVFSPRTHAIVPVAWPEEDDHVPSYTACSSIEIPCSLTENDGGFIPIVYGASGRDERRTPIGVEIGHDLVSSRDSSSSSRAFQTPSPNTMMGVFEISRPTLHRGK